MVALSLLLTTVGTFLVGAPPPIEPWSDAVEEAGSNMVIADDPEDATPRGPASTGEDLVISLVTFGPGDDITEWFGHSAIIVDDVTRGRSRLYNFGEFRFDNTMLPRYVMGHLNFSVGARPVRETLAVYASRDRDIEVQPLRLTPSERLALARRLAWHAEPAHKYYRYDHYTDNCATRPRDLLDDVLGGQLAQLGAAPSGTTLRQETARMTSVVPPMAVLIDLVLNGDVDTPLSRLQQTFLPERLQAFLDTTTVTHDDGTTSTLLDPPVPLALQRSQHSLRSHASQRASIRTTPPTWGGFLLILGCVCGLPLLGRSLGRRWSGRLWSALLGLVAGFLGLTLVAGWLATDHAVVHANLNLLVCSPLALLLVAFSTRRAQETSAPRALYGALLGGVVVALIAWLFGVQDVSWSVAFWGPVWALGFLGAHRRQQATLRR